MGCCGEATRVHSSQVNGRTVPQDFENFEGPIRDRQCRDVIFLLLFATFCGFLGYVLFLAVEKGEPERLLYGCDSYGNVCGKKNVEIPGAHQSGQNTVDKPYLYYNPNRTPPRECVKSCPGRNYTSTILRHCVFIQPHVTLIQQALNITRNFFEELSTDVALCWREVLYMCLIALGLAGVVVILLRFIVGFLIWLVLISLSLASVVGTAYVWYMWRTRKKQVENLALDDPRKSNRETEVTHWFVGAIFATIFTVIFLLIIIIMRKRIELVSALFKEAGKALATMPLLLFQPVVTFITLAAIVVGWFVGYLYIHTAKDVTVDPETDYVTFHLTTFFRLMKWYHLFALFWFTQFVISCQHVVIAGAVATWFFTRDKKKLSTPILTSLYNLIRYHLGSVALGSFVVALLKLIRAIFKCLERHMKKHPTWCNTAIKCCSCCLWCFEKFLIFLNRNAFIEIAIYGYPFCKAAQKAFHLLSNNILRVAAINSVGDFVLLLGKAGVTVATAFIGLELIKDKPGVNYTWVPVTVACIFAFLVSHCFLGIYEMAIDTLFLCFCEDCERNDGINKPYYMSRSLMVFVEDSKKVLEAEKNRRNQGG